MSETYLTMVIMLLCTIFQTGSSRRCMYKTVMLKDVKAISCFKKMQGPACDVNQSSKYCNIEIRNEVTCLKLSDDNIRCLTTETGSDIPIENSTCAVDQEGLSCTKEFPGTDSTNEAHLPTCFRGFYIGFAVSLFMWVTL